jgi:hypothetical protein
MTILIGYHFSQQKCFKYYYHNFILGFWKKDFPQAPSYDRFVNIAHRANMPLSILMLHLAIESGKKHDKFYVDSTKLPVCDNHRIRQNKVFKGTAKRGKTSMGWFYGFKLHLIISPLGDICSFALTAGNVADNDSELLPMMVHSIKGNVYGDAGYISKTLQEKLSNLGLNLYTKIKSNMKNKWMKMEDKILLKKRTIIETVIDLLKSIHNISHTRHRSIANFFNNLIAGLIAYTFREDKPKIKFYQNQKMVLSLENIQS